MRRSFLVASLSGSIVAGIGLAAALAAAAAAPATRPAVVVPAKPPSTPAPPAVAGQPAPAAHPDARIQAFVANYCVSCHGPKVQKADRRFDQLSLPAKTPDAVLDLQDMVDALNLGEMPPKKAKQPSAAEMKDAIASMTGALATAREQVASKGAETVLRRLNRREYINTVGDLFGINMSMFDPTVRFPKDQIVDHMDNMGETLRTSGYLLEQYLAAAEMIVDKAFDTPATTTAKTWTFNGDFRQQPELDKAQQYAFQNRYLCLYESLASEKHEGTYGPIRAFSQGVPTDGWYEIRVKAEAMNRHNNFPPDLFKLDPTDPFRIGVVPGNEKAGDLHLPQPIEPILGEQVLGDGGPEWKTFKVWLDAGFTPRFIFPNGMPDVRNVYAKVASRYKNNSKYRNMKPGGIVTNRIVSLTEGQMPHIRIHEVQIKGPIRDAAAPTPSKIIFGGKPFDPSKAREIIQNFASRAYRRPATTDEVDRLFALYQERLKDKQPALEALKDSFKAILCSPSFLYLAEIKPASDSTAEALSAYDLASRLSYFLWATMPDDELMATARSGDLLKPDVLRAQTKRLLANRRSDAFVQGFINSWLNLRSLGDMPPDRADFPKYYTQDLQRAMYKETELFTRNLIDKNQPVSDFIDCDYSFLNRPLAQLYGMNDAIKPADGYMFRQVKLTDHNRGGLLGQASVLTVSANGVETSPVTRGVWILENILGTPPSPPPDNVPTIDPDVRGAKSIRELLTKHRENATCMECHQKIDPLGFALETFDPIGASRTKYAKGIAIDSSGTLPSGQSFKDLAGLKKVLMERKDQFTQMLAERLLAYGCGRRMEATDRPQVTAIVSETKAAKYGLHSLIESVIQSQTFRSK